MIRYFITSISLLFWCTLGQAQAIQENKPLAHLESDLVIRLESFIENSRYYFVDLKITNNDDSTFRFWVNYSCYLFNVILKGKGFEIIPNSCPTDYPVLITLKKNESANFPILLKQVKAKVSIDDLNLGFVIIPENQFPDDLNLTNTTIKIREAGQQVIWSLNDPPAYYFEPISCPRISQINTN